MTNDHINRYSMYLDVIGVLTKFTAVFAAIPAFVKAVANFTTLANNIGQKSEEIGIGTSPKTLAKRSAESAMTDEVVRLVGDLHAFASSNSDVELMAETNISPTKIHDMRDAERGNYATSLVDLVEPHIADLADWGDTADSITEARGLIADYETSLGGRNEARTGQTSGRDAVMNMFSQADGVLEHQIDRKMKSFIDSNPDFYSEYLAARVVKDIAATRPPKAKGNGKSESSAKPPDSK